MKTFSCKEAKIKV